MIPCFKCKRLFHSLKDLMSHFENFHRMTAIDPVECRYKLCPRTFTSKRSFQKHFMEVHSHDFTECNAPNLANVQNVATTVSSSSFDDREIWSPLKMTVAETYDHMSTLDALLSDSTMEPANNVQIDGTIEEALEAKCFNFCSDMYSHPGIPMSHSEMTVKCVISLIEGINSAYKQKLMSLSNGSLTNESLAGIIPCMNNMCNFVETTLKSYKSKYLVLKTLKKKGFYFPPKQKIIGYTAKRRKFKKKFCVIPVKETSSFIPLRHVFRTLLEQKDVLSNILQYLEDLKSESVIIENFVQGKCWKTMNPGYRSDNCIILPLFLNNDCIEVSNPLSGHSGTNKINATYCSIPCLLPELRASLSNIFLTLLTKSSNLKRFGNAVVFKPVIKELKFLSQKGVSVKPPDGNPVQVYFQLSCLIGDNLGLNTIGGFCKNFSKSEYCCRMCRADMIDRKFLTRERADLLRNYLNYNTDVKRKNFRLTGIHERCTFNDLPFFHIVTNCGCDLTHDIFEGVAQYTLSFIVRHYIRKEKYFSLLTLNERIDKFNYGSADVSNKPPSFPETFHKRKTLKMSASETACFLKYFGLMIGDLVPTEDPVWQMYIALRKVVEIVMTPNADSKTCELLVSYISEFLLLYISLTRQPLTIKFHNLIHYPRLMVLFGPLVHISTIRYESKNRILKIIANAIAGRRNICYSVARKCQLNLSNNFTSQVFSKRTLLIGPNEADKSSDNFFEETANFVFTTPCPEILKNKHNTRTPWLELNGTRYCEGVTLCADIHEKTSLPIFGLVKKIFVCNSKEIFFFLRNFRTLSFNSHLYAFKLELSNSYSILKYEDILDFHLHNAVSVLNDGFYVSMLPTL